jgi:hypothetical protein
MTPLIHLQTLNENGSRHSRTLKNFMDQEAQLLCFYRKNDNTQKILFQFQKIGFKIASEKLK